MTLPLRMQFKVLGDFSVRLDGVAMAARGWGSRDILAAFQRAEELCQKTGDKERLFTALRGRAQYYMTSGRPASYSSNTSATLCW